MFHCSKCFMAVSKGFPMRFQHLGGLHFSCHSSFYMNSKVVSIFYWLLRLNYYFSVDSEYSDFIVLNTIAVTHRLTANFEILKAC